MLGGVSSGPSIESLHVSASGLSLRTLVNPFGSSVSSSPAEAPEGLDSTKPAKQRINRACEACRKRKVKCIMPHDPPCEGCKHAGRDCLFLHQDVKRNKAPTKRLPVGRNMRKALFCHSDVEELNSRIKTLEKALLILSPEIDLSQLPRTADQARSMVNSSRSKKSQINQTRLPKELSTSNTELESVSDLHGVLKHMSQLHLGADEFYNGVRSDASASKPNEWEYTAGSGEPDLAYLMNNNTRPIAERHLEKQHFRNAAKVQHYPPPDLAEKLIKLYFQKVHPYEPMLHQGEFMAQYNAGLAERDCSFRALCYAIFAAASRFSSDDRVSPSSDGQNVDKQASGALYGSASGFLLTPNTLPCTLYDLQAMAVLSFFLVSTCSPLTVWFLLGRFLRRAQGDGVDLDGTPRWETSIMKDQLRKRAFWSLFLREMQLCLSLGRVSCMRQSSSTIGPPLGVDDESLSKFCSDHQGYSLTSAYTIVERSPTFLATSPRCVARGSIFMLQRKINIQLRGLWSLKVVPDHMSWHWDRDLAIQIAQSIDQSIATEIPPEARWHPDLIDEIDFVVTAHLRWYVENSLASYLKILCHRHLIRCDPKELQICLAAASDLLDTLEHLSTRGFLELTAAYTPYLITPAALTWLYSACLENTGLSVSQRADHWADVHRCINLLAHLSHSTFQAEKLKESLNHLVNTCMQEQLFPGSTAFGQTMKRDASAMSAPVDSFPTITLPERLVPSGPSSLITEKAPLAESRPDSLKAESENSYGSPIALELFNMSAPQLDASLFHFPGKVHVPQVSEQWPMWITSCDPTWRLLAQDSTCSYSQPGSLATLYSHVPKAF
ncbi:hypothetical protein CROQUDRAFT_136168 [Cronartium quercuum f. sp. fusiforme G11]|uniref:Zn(2)-C6 fungal-type domain-containing protein n=1 Tax=Cronartium quercuum f. sp. fusiforme G11 TaxID=708437 RepID=A0A9P6N9A8_9BASI|nr:hypothetical protein CROQUDRAFT_136168 [Cronartium quercuum f. sp. fusiforme G11]